jgi:hypothetical protein
MDGGIDPPACLATGQRRCYDPAGRDVPCAGSGQDGESRTGQPWPDPRHAIGDGLVRDLLTGLVWTRDANPPDTPLFWGEALEFVRTMNRDRWLGFADWRLPNRRELRSLVSFETRKPALPADHPFVNLVEGWYWTSTSAAIAPTHAWYIHMAGARMFYGRKDESCLVWPVRGAANGVLPATGQTRCYDEAGRETADGAGQDGALRLGRPWPTPRFTEIGDDILDRLTGLAWRRRASLSDGPVDWREALAAVTALNRTTPNAPPWRLPNINELESLVDCSTHSPALPAAHPFAEIGQGYWSSTTSAFEPDWAWALYLDKGAIGVGQKRGRHFGIWPVRGPLA